MLTKIKRSLRTIALPVFLMSSVALAEEDDTIHDSYGISVSAELSSIYNYRGMNMFMEKSISDHNGLFAPSISWTIFNSGFSIGYWGAYQITGNNISEMIDSGLGCEQDLFVGFQYDFIDELLSMQLSLTYFFYPIADKDIAGTANPSFLEPLLSLDYTGIIDIGLKVSYFAGLQDELSLYRYLYLNPTIGKTIPLRERYAMAVGFSFGYKLFNDRDKMTDNVFDARLDWSFPIKLTDIFYAEPGIHLSWTNIDKKTVLVENDMGLMEEISRNANPGDGLMVYVSLLIGADF